ncbi:hypothetical protein SKAU_G00294470 [Synaphobranchus kaupii]|uniref:Endoplasmic reticulum membrane sensor NFE2L1 n=1 Tax=Synaphobranchus kaupii TaxID=118154 RepID=A0A9Q1IMF0_SYNKA|nr:hypothetical protein SKAU_G00294470 [Synaphobranchus kaupii]
MLYLKKYFTEGLIQFTILLSLIGVQVDVDTYLSSQLPPLHEIILGPSSAYTQTQFHNLRNTLDGYGIHPKSVDLDYFFASRRLLNQVRSLDRLSVPSTELSAWLVHRDPEAVVSAGGQSGPSIALDNGSGLEDDEQEQGANVNHNLTKEDIDLIDILWRQDIDLGAGREVFDYSSRQKESEAEKLPPEEQEEEEEEAEREESWRNGLNLRGGHTCAQVDGETGENIPEQLASLGAQTSVSLQECLRLLEATFPFGEEPEFPGTATPQLSGEGPSTSQGLTPAPLLPQNEPCLDLEQQWQDIMAIMEFQDMEVNSDSDGSFLESNSDGGSGSNHTAVEAGPLVNFSLSDSATPINQNVSLHQASMPSCSQELGPFFSPSLESCVSMETPGPSPPASLGLSSSNSSNFNSTFGATNLTGLFLPPPLNGTANSTVVPPLPDPLSVLLEEAMLDEISLLDLALEEGFSHTQASQLGEELDSDSGLSLDSPVSPSSSETSCSSGSSSCSSASFSEEGAMGYSTDSEPTAETEEGAVGGYQPEHSKFCRMSYHDPSRFHSLPRLEHIGHNHTYNLPLSSPRSPQEEPQPARGKRPGRDRQPDSKLQPQDLLDKQASRDERRARAMKIPFSNEKIINLPVEEFNELLAKHRLSEAQLALVRDIRRRGKNKMAAQNCRKRKLDTILNLEHGVDALRRDKARLLKEKMEFLRSIRQMKHKVQGLYRDVFAQLRDEAGRPYSASEYALQFGSDGSVLVVPRHLATEQSRKPEKKQKDKKK